MLVVSRGCHNIWRFTHLSVHKNPITSKQNSMDKCAQWFQVACLKKIKFRIYNMYEKSL